MKKEYIENIAIGIGLFGGGLSSYGMADGLLFGDELLGNSFYNATLGAFALVGSYFYILRGTLKEISKNKENKLEEKLQ